VQLLIWIGWSIYKLRLLVSLDAGELPVTDMLRRVSRLRLMIIRERLWGGVATLIFFLVPALILTTYWMTGSTAMLTNWHTLALEVSVVVLVTLPVGFWVYRRCYVAPIDDIIENLREIEAFEQA
jgi:hypothetical protein